MRKKETKERKFKKQREKIWNKNERNIIEKKRK